MSYKVNFLDNELISAADLNEVAASVGGDASAFKDNMVYGVDDLNDISATLITKGIANGCILSSSVNETGKGVVTVGTGNLFMPDGKRVEIDEEGVSLSFTLGNSYYVWFYHDSVTGFVTPCCTTNAPRGDYVLLGQVTEKGEVMAQPDRAMMKNSFAGLNKTEVFTYLYTCTRVVGQTTLICELTPEQLGYRRAIIYAEQNDGIQVSCGHVNLEDGTSFSVLKTHMETGIEHIGQDGAILSMYYDPGSGGTFKKVFLRLVLGTDNILRLYEQLIETGRGGIGYSGLIQNLQIILC
ncbi:MAG: hypothetical protein E7393_04820 [Ruminococcaceae bacterium]|nr:hypothetical protein [Oscillospiraceae bacterium]